MNEYDATQKQRSPLFWILLLSCTGLCLLLSPFFLSSSQETHASTTYAARPPQSTATVVPSPTPQLTPTAISTGFDGSFENASTQGWQRVGNIFSIKNSTTLAHQGSHSLQVTFQSHTIKDFPSIYYQNTLTSTFIKPGATFTAYIYVPQKTVDLSVKLFVSNLYAGQFAGGTLETIPSQRWFAIRMPIPQGSIPWDTIGIQMHNSHVNVNSTLYFDDVHIS